MTVNDAVALRITKLLREKNMTQYVLSKNRIYSTAVCSA